MSLRKINEMICSGELALHKVSISGELPGFVYTSKKGRSHVFVDESLSPDAERDTMAHECAHIILHAKPGAYIIGLDDRKHEREREAETYVREHRAEYLNAR